MRCTPNTDIVFIPGRSTNILESLYDYEERHSHDENRRVDVDKGLQNYDMTSFEDLVLNMRRNRRRKRL